MLNLRGYTSNSIHSKLTNLIMKSSTKFFRFSLIAANLLAIAALAPAISLALPSAAFSQPQGENRANRPNFPELNLTEAQKSQMKSLSENTRKQINEVLTDAQKSQLQASIKSGTKPRAAMQALNLSEDQKSKIRAIKESGKQSRQALLTPEQKQKLSEYKGKRSKPPVPVN